ncbi:hypothetical protein CPER28S_01970 [Cellulomonas persica]
MVPARRHQPAVAVRQRRRRLLQAQVDALGQGARRERPVHGRRRGHHPVVRERWHQPAVQRPGRRRLHPAHRPAQRQGRRGAERVHRGRGERRAVRGLERHQPAVAAGAARRDDATAADRHVHQPRGLAGLRRRRHHPRGRRVLLLGVDDALLTRRADPALVRPRELGVRRPLGAAARLRRRGLRPVRRPQVRQGHLGLDARVPPEQPHVLLARLHRVQPDVRLHRIGGGRHVVEEGAAQHVLLRRGPAGRRRRHHVRRVRQRDDQRRAAQRRRHGPGARAAGVPDAVERRHARRAPGSTSAAATTTSGSHVRRTASTCCARRPRSDRTRCARCC